MGKPKAYSVPSFVPRNTWLPPADNPPPCADEAIVLPLDHSSLPVAASSAYRTAGDEPETAKTTPFRMIGVSGETMSREIHPGCRVGAPAWSTTFHATIAPFTGASTQRLPSASCQLASAPGTKSAAFESAGVLYPVPPSAALSTRCIRPSWVVAAIRFFLLY